MPSSNYVGNHDHNNYDVTWMIMFEAVVGRVSPLLAFDPFFPPL